MSGIPSSVLLFLAKKAKPPPRISSAPPAQVVGANVFSACSSPFTPSLISSHRHFYKQQPPPVHTQPQRLPEKPTDIKGIDSFAHKFINRKQSAKAAPVLVKNKFFHLKFFPHTNLLSAARKSNIAYTFTNTSGGYNFNNPVLSEGFDKYKGKYKKLLVFQKRMSPMNSAVKRILFRRIVKRALFSAISKVDKQAVQKVAGIFQFRLSILPNVKERLLVEESLSQAIRKLASGTIKVDPLTPTRKERDAFTRQLRLYCPPGEENVRGYYPRFPFVGSRGNEKKKKLAK